MVGSKTLYYTWGPDTLTRRGTFGGTTSACRDKLSILNLCRRRAASTLGVIIIGNASSGAHSQLGFGSSRCKTARNVVSVMQCNDADLLLSRNSINVGGGGAV